MRVVLPYTEIKPGVEKALVATGYPYEKVDLRGSDENYWNLLHDLWATGETFALVEHDILVRPDTLAELDDCPNLWCAFQAWYQLGPRLTQYAGLSCIRFRDELIRAVPYALDEVAGMSDQGHPKKHWCRLDAWLQERVLRQARIPVPTEQILAPPGTPETFKVWPVGTFIAEHALAQEEFVNPKKCVHIPPLTHWRPDGAFPRPSHGCC